jgi:2-dehydropantoate 2-reductase
MKVAIVGAGAIGGWIGIRLAQAGEDVSALARGHTLEALRARPWTLESNGQTVGATVRASADPDDLGIQDIVVIALKGPALASAAPAISRLIGPDTLVVPAMNGVPWWFLLGGAGELPAMSLDSIDPDRTIEQAIPFHNVIGCVVHASAFVRGPGQVAHKAGNRLILGEPNGAPTDRLRGLAEMFDRAGFDVEKSERIQHEIWYKLWGNMTMNPISALTGATCDRILDDPLINGFILRVMAEAKAVGARIGCAIEERGEDRNGVTRQLGAFKTSMLQDAEAGRAIELDQIVSAPLEVARKLHIETPNLEALLGLTRLHAQVHGLYPTES